VDSDGNAIEFMLSARRDAKADKLFFKKALKASRSSSLELTNIKMLLTHQQTPIERRGYPSGILRTTPVKYLNNIIEQDNRFIKK
jgi:transposase, IS6 family